MNKTAANFILATCLVLIGTSCSAAPANDNVYYLMDKANREFIAHRSRPAVAYALQAVKVAPNNFDARKLLGYIYFNIDMMPEAITALRAALHISPKSGESVVYVQLGKALVLMKNNSEALQVFSQGVTNVKDNAELLNERGCLYAINLQFDRAIADISEAIKKNPTHAHYYNERANVYMHAKQYAKAVADYTSTLKYEPNAPMIYAERGRAYKAMGKLDLAEKDMTRSTEIFTMGQ